MAGSITSGDIQKNLDALNVSLAGTVKLIEQIAVEAPKISKAFKEVKGINEYNKAQKKATENLDLLAKKTVEVEKIEKQTSNLLAKTSAQRTEQAKKLARLNVLRQEQNKKIKQEIQLEQAQENSIKKLRLENKKLRAERDLVNTATDDGVAKIKELNKVIDENDSIIRSNTDAYTERKIGIGEYNTQIQQAFEETGLLNSILGATGESFQEIFQRLSQGKKFAKSTASIGDGFEGAKKGAVSFKKALIAIPIFAVIAAISALVGYFKQTEEGAQKLRIITAGLGAAFDVIMVKVFEFGRVLFEQISKAANWLGKLGKYLGIVRDSTDDAKDSEDSFLDVVNKQVKAAVELEKNRIALTKANRSLAKSVEELAKQEALLTQAADDDTKSFKLQKQAAEDLSVVLINKSAKEFAIARNNLKLVNDEIALRKVNKKAIGDLLDQQLEAQTALIQAETDFLTTKEENEIRIRKINRDRFEQDLDILIDISDSKKTQLERQINDEANTAAQRRELLNQGAAAQEQVFAQEVALFEKYTGQKIDFNSLLAEDDLNVLNNRLQNEFDFNEITINRLRETLIERRAALQDFADVEKEINKLALQEQQNELEKSFLEREVKAAESYARGEKSAEDYAKILADNEIEKNKLILESELATDEQILQARKNLADLTISEQEKTAAKQKEIDDGRLDDAYEAVDATMNILSGIFALDAAQRDARFAKINEQRDAELKRAGDDEEKKAAINAKFDAIEAREKKKQAIANKRIAIFEAIVNTSVAVTKLLANPFLAIAAGIAGAAQVAAIVAQPIPAFAEGVKNFGGGKALVGEAGAELVQQGNKLTLAKKATIMNLDKGANVFTADETNRILANTAANGRIEDRRQTKKDITPELLIEIKQLRKDSNSRPQPYFNLTEKGLETGYNKYNSKRVNFNKSFKY